MSLGSIIGATIQAHLNLQALGAFENLRRFALFIVAGQAGIETRRESADWFCRYSGKVPDVKIKRSIPDELLHWLRIIDSIALSYPVHVR